MREVIIKNDKYELLTIILEGEIATKTIFTTRAHQKAYMGELLSRLMISPLPYTVPVHSCEYLASEYHTHPHGYRYTMDRLLPLSVEEKDLVHIFSGLDDMLEDEPGYHRRFDQDEQVLAYQERIQQFPTLEKFLEDTTEAGYHDMHGDNVMKNADSHYKLIDLETFIHVDVDGGFVFPC